MTFRRKPTEVQGVMIALMASVFVLLGVWLVPELIGVFSHGTEDTYSEWVFDLPTLWMFTIAAAHLIVGVVFVWSAGHFVEGYKARRKQENL